MKFVIDTNILISALIKDSITRRIIAEVENNFFYPKISLQEISKYKKLILEKSRIKEKEYVKLFNSLLKKIILVSDESIQQKLNEANKLLGKVDSDDVVFLACAIALNAGIWSDDKHFRRQNKVKVFTTTDFMKKFLKVSKKSVCFS